MVVTNRSSDVINEKDLFDVNVDVTAGTVADEKVAFINTCIVDVFEVVTCSVVVGAVVVLVVVGCLSN